ncbi:MAG: hypothetical protein LBK66_12160 [Spirochaetaceae bacterium]|nr:hypothetical protein [Spirochaetaceae bacterium]
MDCREVVRRAGCKAVSQAENADNERMGAGKKAVQYDGEFVLTADDKKDFGEIPAESGLKSGKIVLRIGEHDEITGKGYGEKHIERDNRASQLRKNGYSNARDFVEHIAKDYDTIYEAGNGTVFVVKHDGNEHIAVVKLEKLNGNNIYDVKTAYIGRRDFFRNKKKIWDVGGRSPPGVKPPSAFSGHPNKGDTPQERTTSNT